MKKAALLLLVIPLIITAHIKDERLFKSEDVPSSAMILLDRSGSMSWDPGSFPPYEWTIINRNGASEVWRSSGYSHSGDNSAVIEDYYTQQVALVTKAIDLSGTTNPTLSFWQMGDELGDYDYWGVWASTTSQSSWGDYSELQEVGPGNTFWQQQTIDLSSYAGQDTVYIAFYYDEYWGTWWWIDDVTIYDGSDTLLYEGFEEAYDTRIEAAIAVLKDLLDANGDGTINEQDEEVLDIRLGYGFHYSQNVYLPPGGTDTDTIGSSFADIWDDINNTYCTGGTPNGHLLEEASNYISDWKNNHPDLWCMKHNLILITDGVSNTPTVDCSHCENRNVGGGYTDYSCSKDVVHQAYKVWHDDTINVYAVGFGPSIYEYGSNELNWTSYHGGTQKADSATIANLVAGGMDTTAVHANSCAMNWPADNFLTGYAYVAKSADALRQALLDIFSDVSGKNFSYSSGEVTSVQEEFISTEYQSRIYFASFQPDSLPLWRGNLRALKLVAGSFDLDSIPDSLIIWSAKDSLSADMSADGRNIYGIRSDNQMLPFTTSNFDSTDLDVSSSQVSSVIDRVRDGLTDDNAGELGDIFHSSPLRIHLPNYFYQDEGFDEYYNRMADETNGRSSLLYAGANDGMLHCFADTIKGQGGRGGEEIFAVVPMNFVSEVKGLLDEHYYFVDADPFAADIWFPENDDDENKEWDEWHAVLLASQGEGGRVVEAFDVTDPLGETPHPVNNLDFLFSTWQDSTLRDTMGYTVGLPRTVKIGKKWHDSLKIDRFYAFIPGGQWPDPMDISLLDTIFYGGEMKGNMIIAVNLWKAATSGITGNYRFIPPAGGYTMDYPFLAAPAALNINPEYGNRMDYVFIPDAAGQLWFVDIRNPDPTKWEADLIFQPEMPASSDSSELENWHPTFYRPFAWKDPYDGSYWVSFGTGNRSDLFSPSEARIFTLHYPDSVLDDSTQTPPMYTEGDLTTLPGSPSDEGWKLMLSHGREKVVTQPLYYLDSLRFYTFSPGSDTTLGPCDIGGTGSVARSYIFDIRTGGTPHIGGTIEGSGLPQPPSYSYSLGGEGMSSTLIGSKMVNEELESFKSFKEIIKWKEK